MSEKIFLKVLENKGEDIEPLADEGFFGVSFFNECTNEFKVN